MLEFATEISLDHLAEASFLYEQRLGLFDDPELTWQDLEDFEQRFEPHIDGLVVGEDLALEVCKQQALEGDFGELHAAMRVFCRQNRLDLTLETLEQIDSEDKEKLQAVSDALKHELPEAWRDDFIWLLRDGNPKIAPALATVIGYQRLLAGQELLQALQKNGNDASATLIWSLGRVREQNARGALFERLQQDDEAIRAAAALALLRLGESQTSNYCLQFARSQNWPIIPLGLSAGRSVVPYLLDLARADKPSTDCLIALGLLGDLSPVETLLAHLNKAELAETAARALHLLTGAELYEEVFIPEEIDEDALFEDELEKLKRGESLTPPGEKSPGATIARLSQKPEEWMKWWAQNKSRFDPRLRYRNGKPYSPACLLENLESEKSPRLIRQLAYEELVIRYGADFPFETDMFVTQQKQTLAKYAEWIKANGSRFREGKWYFAGLLLAA